MLKYLIVLLDDTSTSYCHYENPKTEHKLISLQDLRAAILLAMKENLMVQFVYPDYKLPQKYEEIIETTEHCKIMPVACCDGADIIIWDYWENPEGRNIDRDKVYVLRTKKEDFFSHYEKVGKMLIHVARLNIILTDVDTFTETDFDKYKSVLAELAFQLKGFYNEKTTPQFNLLTDRMLLDSMNNCNAGWENITLAPDGKFYVCPAFYLSGEGYSIGDLDKGLDIRNPQLYRLSHAPLCRHCDAYQCKRCIWLNRKMTLEVNTPSHEQCVTAHLERNASRDLLQEIRKSGRFLQGREIMEIDYLDPFDVRKKY